ncbi:tetratricopeptide repeat protein [Polynucleobacter sp. MWH-UH2A]|uniref:tetratricopeptide repeat protein n=1 Tax=Polynucleobacter sp. MWH-UH2A TaxID=1855617 RepID=UPI001BFD692C|nr:tetratricopeptide repeat protein [Polynucleobacter sp. MWH-UH2A]QWD63389.1 tetratricopeptide repeat protein [Polynucleobacter sp. MWH-UH2A]
MNKWVAIGLLVFVLGYCSRSPRPVDKASLQAEQRLEDGECDAVCIQAKALQAEDDGDLEMALTLNQELAQLDSGNPAVENTVAGLHGALSRYDEEISWAKRALQSNPRYEQAYINWGNALLAQKQYAKAKERFSQALVINPQSAIAHYHLGLTLDWEGQLEQALVFYQKALSLDSRFEDAYYNAATVLANLRRYPEARRYLQQLLDLNPQDAQARALLQELGAIR